ncbi:MAG: C39 family peptidase [Thermoplasmatales archaeon]|nr:C39 family peptidase [Thermoplasmatales archaeon]
MKNKKYLVIGVIVTFLLVNIQSVGSVTNDLSIDTFKSTKNKDGIDSHLIEGVPYVSQETGLYCAYASATMIFKYYGINTSLEEVLYITGAGSSLAYNYNQRSLMGGFTISRNYSYIACLYNLSRNKWKLNTTGKTQEYCWNEYWTRVKENISNNCPVWTFANPFQLKSTRSIGNFPDFIMDLLPSSHAIVIVGYNESNNTICFNDPMSGVFGYPEIGTYVWMGLNDYKKAVWSAAKFHESLGFIDAHIAIDTYNKISAPPPKELILNEVYLKNIERMKGNFSTYDGDGATESLLNEFKDFLGINALIALSKDFGPGIINRLSQTRMLKKNNIGFPILILLAKILKLDKSYDSAIDEQVGRPYIFILRDKEFQYRFIENNTDNLQISNEVVDLYRQELENWTAFYNHYKLFTERGLRLNIIRGFLKVRKMSNNLENIVGLQNEIILKSGNN